GPARRRPRRGPGPGAARESRQPATSRDSSLREPSLTLGRGDLREDEALSEPPWSRPLPPRHGEPGALDGAAPPEEGRRYPRSGVTPLSENERNGIRRRNQGACPHCARARSAEEGVR